MNQGIFGFPNSNDALDVASVNGQIGQVKVFTKGPGRQIGVTDMGRGTSGYQTGGGGYSDVWYGPYNSRGAAANTGAVTANRLYLNPHYFPYPTRVRALLAYSGNTVTTGNVIMGIYEADEFGLPTRNIYTSASTAVGSGYSQNIVRNNGGLTPPLQGFYLFGAIFDSTPTMSVCGSGNQGYGQEIYGTINPLNGIASFGMQVDVGSYTMPRIIKKQDIVFCDYGSGSAITARIDYGVVGQVGV